MTLPRPGAAAVFIALLLGAACGGPAPTSGVDVVASFYPLYEFARQVGGERVTVRMLVPAGVEPHDFEPAPGDVAAMHKARLVIYNGAGLEPWVERLRPQLPGGTVVVRTTAGLPLLKGAAEEPEPPALSPPTPAEERGLDPHVWLDPLLARRQVEAILAGLLQVDPDGRDTYTRRAAALQADLEALHQRYAASLAACERRVFVTAHAAFAYLARRYGLRMIAVAGLSPEAEVPAARIAEVARLARQYGVRVVYFETLASPRVAETIAREVGARTAVLDPLEGLTPEAQRQGKNYFTVVDENRRALVDGLACR